MQDVTLIHLQKLKQIMWQAASHRMFLHLEHFKTLPSICISNLSFYVEGDSSASAGISCQLVRGGRIFPYAGNI